MIYPVFLPHAGCPFQCVYCNQRVTVSGESGEGGIAAFVRARLAEYGSRVERSGRSGEIAFYGGTFTALPLALVEEILSACEPFVSRGIFTGVRFSTRPDCLQADVVGLLSRYPVRTVELGVQSLSDTVLEKSRRGYDTRTVFQAAKAVKQNGWSLGVQLMAGLPGDSAQIFLLSIKKALGTGADFFRIYPTLVLEGTALARAYREGAYTPWSLEEAVANLAPAYGLALEARVPVIRMGLQADAALEKPGVVVAGPYHPAFGALVKARWWRARIDARLGLEGVAPGAEVMIHVAPDQVSDVIGNRKSNLLHWQKKWYIRARVVGDSDLGGIETSWKITSSNRDISPSSERPTPGNRPC